MAEMNEIEIVATHPLVLDIVYHEAQVWRYPGGLDGG